MTVSVTLLFFLATDQTGFHLNRGQAPSAYQLLTTGGLAIRQNGFDVASRMGEAARFRFHGCLPGAWQAAGAVQGTVHYQTHRFQGQNSIYSRAERPSLYRGIDWIFRLEYKNFEYDFVIAPGADPRQIQLQVDGPVDQRDGAFYWRTSGGLLQRAPVAYQEVSGSRQIVSSRWMVSGQGIYRLQLGPYRRDLPLIVDPLIESSEVFGGSDEERVVGVGPGWVAGVTRSIDWERELEVVSGSDVFVRMGSDVFLFGGEGEDEARAAVQDSSGRIGITGWTNSRRLPVLDSAGQRAYGGGAADGFFVAFQSRGLDTVSGFVDATYVGGDGDDRIWGLAGSLLVGETNSSRWPGRDPVRIGTGGGSDALLAMVRTGAMDLVRLGGSGEDRAFAAIISAGQFILAGETISVDFPRAPEGATGIWLGRATWPFGASRPNWGMATISRPKGITTINGMASLPGQAIYLVGDTRSAAGEPRDGLLLRFEENSLSLLGATSLGGSGDDRILAVVRRGPDLLLGGVTDSPNFPWRGDPLPDQTRGGKDGFLAHVDEVGRVVWSSPVGGPQDDEISALDATAKVWCGGATSGDAFVKSVSYSFVAAAPIVLGKDLQDELKLTIVNDAETDTAVRIRSDDPSRLLLSLSSWQVGGESVLISAAQSADQLSFVPRVYLQALATDGEVDLILRGPRYPERRVRVKLAPSAIYARQSRWIGNTSAAVGGLLQGEIFLAAAVEDGLQPVPRGPRPGVEAAMEWRSSDPSGLTDGTPSGSSGLDFIVPMSTQAWRKGEYTMTPYSPAFPTAPRQQLSFTVSSTLQGMDRLLNAVGQNTITELLYQPQFPGAYRLIIEDPEQAFFMPTSGGAVSTISFPDLTKAGVKIALAIKGSGGKLTIRVEGPNGFNERLILPIFRTRVQVAVSKRRIYVGASTIVMIRVVPFDPVEMGGLGSRLIHTVTPTVIEGDPGMLATDSVWTGSEGTHHTLRCQRPGTVTIRIAWPDAEPWETTLDCLSSSQVPTSMTAIQVSPGLDFLYFYPSESLRGQSVTQDALFTIRDPSIALINEQASYRHPSSFSLPPRIRAVGRLGQRTTLTVSKPGFPDFHHEIVIVPAIMRRSAPPKFNDGFFEIQIIATPNAPIPVGQTPWEAPLSRVPKFETNSPSCTLDSSPFYLYAHYSLQLRCEDYPRRIRIRDASGWLSNELDVPLPEVLPADSPTMTPITIGNGFQLPIRLVELARFTGMRGAGFSAISDESRIRLSIDPLREGSGEVRFDASPERNPYALLWLQAYAGEGSTRVVFTNGKRRVELLVHLRPGTFGFRPDSESREIPLSPTGQTLVLFPAWTDSELGAVFDHRFRVRPGLPLARMPVLSSDPATISVNGPTPLFLENLGPISLGIRTHALGSATIGVTLPEGFADSPQRSIQFRVVRNVFTMKPIYVGPGIHSLLELKSNLQFGAPITITSLDPDKVLLASSTEVGGVAKLEVRTWDNPRVSVVPLSGEGTARLLVECLGVASELRIPLYPTALGLAAPFNSEATTWDELLPLHIAFGPVVQGRIVRDSASYLKLDPAVIVTVSSEDEAIAQPQKRTLFEQSYPGAVSETLPIRYGRPGQTNLIFQTRPGVANRIEKLPVRVPPTL